MKVSLLPLAVLLTVAALHSEAKEEPANNMTHCCLSYISRVISLRAVKGYDRSSNQCSIPAIIFTTKGGQQICVNPSDAWVQRYIRILDRKSRKSGLCRDTPPGT